MIPQIDFKKFSEDPSSFSNELGTDLESQGVAEILLDSEVGSSKFYEKVSMLFNSEHRKDFTLEGWGYRTYDGDERNSSHEIFELNYLPSDSWPTNKYISRFQEVMEKAYYSMSTLAYQLMSSLDCYLGVQDSFHDNQKLGRKALILLKYDGNDACSLRVSSHEDPGLTLLPKASRQGLEILTKDGNWITANPGDQGVLVFPGTAIERHSKGKIKALTHRVTKPNEDKERLATTFVYL